MMRTQFHIVAVLAFAAAMSAQAAPEPVHVQIWTGGDDGLTQRLRDALETGIRKSGVFQLVNSEGMKADDFVILIPGHVAWEKTATGTVVTAKAQFSRADHPIDEVSVTCREETLRACAAQIVGSAKKAAAKP